MLAELKRRGWLVAERRLRRWNARSGPVTTQQAAHETHDRCQPRLARVPEAGPHAHAQGPRSSFGRPTLPTCACASSSTRRLILDVFSRRAVGWAVGPALRTELPLTALEQALRERQPVPGLVHHSDRGSQYASKLYVQRLKDHEIVISMSRKGNPYGQRLRREFHQDAEGRGGLLRRI